MSIQATVIWQSKQPEYLAWCYKVELITPTHTLEIIFGNIFLWSLELLISLFNYKTIWKLFTLRYDLGKSTSLWIFDSFHLKDSSAVLMPCLHRLSKSLTSPRKTDKKKMISFLSAQNNFPLSNFTFNCFTFATIKTGMESKEKDISRNYKRKSI